MRILMLNHNVAWRSTFFRAFYFARELVQLGHSVTVVTISPTARVGFDESVKDGVRIVQSPDLGVGIARTGWDPMDTLARTLRFLKEDFDIVHGFDCRPVVLIPSLMQRVLGGAKYVTDWADWWGRGGAISERKSFVGRVLFAPFETVLEEQFRRFAHQVTVTSHALYDRAVALGLRKDTVHYLPSGANVRDIRVLDRAVCRTRLGLEQNAAYACFVGFVQYDLELVIRSFKEVLTTLPAARLILAGPQNNECSKLANSLGLSDKIHDLGPQPFEKISIVLGAADVLLLPVSDNLMNRARGPIKLGDYLAAGRPIITNPVGDLKSVFLENNVGELSGDRPSEYGAAILGALSNPALSVLRGENARALAERKLAWRFLTPQLEAIYDRAMAGF